MSDRKWHEAIAARDDGDVMPEAVPYLRLGSGLDAYAWGWNDREEGLPPPEGGSLARGLMWGAVISLALWTLILTGLYWAVKGGWWR